MKNNNQAELVSWQTIKQQVEEANPLLAAHIESISPKNTDTFVLAHYPFGQDIISNDKINLPGNNANLLKELHYPPCPIGLILDNSAEIYHQLSDRVISNQLLKQGDLFGASNFFDQTITNEKNTPYHISSGAKSIFMLPKISDWISHGRLKKALGIQQPPPKNLFEHQKVFAEIIQKSEENLKNPWSCTVLYFTKEWMKKIELQTGESFKLYLLSTAWENTYPYRRQFENNVFWEEFISLSKNSGINLSNKTTLHLKQICSIREGLFPGMTFATENNELIGPIQLIQKIYSDIYRIKKYAPTIMYADNIKQVDTVYCSLNHPNYLDTQTHLSSALRLMDELKSLKEAADKSSNHIPHTDLSKIEMFHPMVTNHSKIQSTKKMIEFDPYLTRYFHQNQSHSFANNSPFLKGCIGIK